MSAWLQCCCSLLSVNGEELEAALPLQRAIIHTGRVNLKVIPQSRAVIESNIIHIDPTMMPLLFTHKTFGMTTEAKVLPRGLSNSIIISDMLLSRPKCASSIHAYLQPTIALLCCAVELRHRLFLPINLSHYLLISV